MKPTWIVPSAGGRSSSGSRLVGCLPWWGRGIMFLMRRGSKEAALVSETGFYSSQEKSGHWFMVGFGAIFILLPSPAYLEVWKEVSRGDYMILMVLLFPLVGAGMAFAGWKMRQNYRFFGPTPLAMDPEPGQAGGQVGGQIHLGRAVPEDASLTVWLSCIRCYYSGSGKDRKTPRVRALADQSAGLLFTPGRMAPISSSVLMPPQTSPAPANVSGVFLAGRTGSAGVWLWKGNWPGGN